MTINIDTKNDFSKISLEGMLNSASAEDFQAVVSKVLAENITSVELDLSKLTYTSSQGLRMILMLHKGIAAKSGSMVLTGVCPAVKEVFDITGFSSILTIK